MTSQLKKYFFESDQQISIHEALYEVNQHLHSYEGVYHFYYAKILERLDVDQSHLISIIDQLEKGYAKKDPFSMFLYAKYLQVEKSPFYQPEKHINYFLKHNL